MSSISLTILYMIGAISPPPHQIIPIDTALFPRYPVNEGSGQEVFLGVGDDGWKVMVDDGGVTIVPSILMRGGCGSHFFITKGEVKWIG